MKYDRNGNVVIDLSFRNLSPKQKKTIKYCLIGVLALAFVAILASTCCLKGQHFIQYGGNKKRENTT